MDKITKKEAQKQGLIYYYTGKVCKHGHDSVRMVSGGTCRECKRIDGEKNRNKDREKYNKICRESKRKHYTTEKRRQLYQKNIATELYNHAKTRAKIKGIVFTIEPKDVIIPEVCPIFDVPFSFVEKEMSPSLDRKNNDLGYIKENVFVISKRANRIKTDATINELEKILQYMKTNIEVKNA
jgi:hypothetical protein